jgi:hypothetical protein
MGKQSERSETELELSHLRRGTRTALELAVVGMAPTELLERLAAAAGLLEAVSELPLESAPVVALIPKLAKRSRSVLEEWNKWQREHLAKTKA